MLFEGFNYALRLAGAQQTVIDKNARQLVANGAVGENRHHR
jgi:hypothetical protein